MTTQSGLRRLTTTVFFFFCWLLIPAGLQAQLKYLTTVSGGGDFQIKITGYTGTVSGTLVIPATINDLPVTTIGTSAFVNQNEITGVSLPASLTTIESHAFQNCSGLTSVAVPEGVTMLYDYAFWNCTALVSASLPSTLSSVGRSTFQGCTALSSVSLSEGLLTIREQAFAGCTALASISLPASLAEIKFGAFDQCSALLGFNIDAANTNYADIDGVVFNKTLNTLIAYPQAKAGAYAVPAGVTAIGPGAFRDAVRLSAVTLPDGLSSIGSQAFYGCEALLSVTIPAGVSSIPNYAFAGCKRLVSVSLPASVSLIGDYAFAQCNELMSVNLPSGLTVLNTGVFRECTRLNGVTVPSTVTRVMADAFYGCAGMTTISLPAGVTTIGEYAFNGCASLATITLPDNLITLGDRAFAGCTGLTSITLNPSLLLIGSSVFDHCASLTSIDIPAVISIGGNNFIGCDSLTAINVDASAATVSSLNGVYFNKDKTTLLAYPRGKTGTYTIPGGVTHIVTWAFSGANHLSGITLTEGLLSIDSLAFSNCDALTGVNLPASLYYFGNGAFSDCDNLTAITVAAGNTSFVAIDGVLFSASTDKLWQYPAGKAGPYAIPPGVTQMESSAFAGAKLLTAVTAPDSLYAIPSYAFADCLALQTVGVGASVNGINDEAFRGCKSLQSFDVAPANTYFASEDGVLFDASRTTLINFPKGRAGIYTIPAGVTTVERQAFLDADLLETVIVPAGVGSLGDSGFADCARLTKLYFYGNAPTLINAASMFRNHTDGFAVYFFHDATGFTTPTWNGYPAVDMGGHRSFVTWLISHRLEHDTDPAVAANDAGVSLLESYALALDPFDATATELPQAAFDAGTGALSIRYHAGTDGVIYTPETSTDLRQWTTDGVDVSPPDVDQHRTATVNANGPARFLRLRLGL